MKKVRNWEFFVFMLVAILALSCSTQSVYAQEGSFKKAVKKGRRPSEPYVFTKEYVLNEKLEKYRTVAREIGYEILDLEITKKYYPRSCDFKLTFIESGHRGDLGIEAQFMQKVNKKIYFPSEYWVNKNVKGSDFKSVGSVYIFTHEGIKKYDDAKWTGTVSNGMLDGRGDGYIRKDSKRYSFSGTFINGAPQRDVVVAYYDDRFHPKASVYNYITVAEIYKSEYGETSEGMTLYKVNGKYGFIDESCTGGVAPYYSEVKSGFVNGIATVKYGSYWIKINKRNKCVEFLPNQYSSETAIYHSYFNSIPEVFDELKTLQVPSVQLIDNEAFSCLTSLEEVTFMEGVKDVRSKAFASCKNLKKVVFPNTLKEMSINTFNGCSSLETIVIPTSFDISDKARGNRGVFGECPRTMKMYWRQKNGTVYEYKNWREDVDRNLEDRRSDRIAEDRRYEKAMERANAKIAAENSTDANSISVPDIKRKVEGNHYRVFDSNKDYTDDDTYVFADGVSIKVYHHYRKGVSNYYYPVNITDTDMRYKTAEDAARAG